MTAAGKGAVSVGTHVITSTTNCSTFVIIFASFQRVVELVPRLTLTDVTSRSVDANSFSTIRRYDARAFVDVFACLSS